MNSTAICESQWIIMSIQISVMDSTVSQIHHSQICFPFTLNGQQVKETVTISLCKYSSNSCRSSESLKHLTDYFSKATWTTRYTDTQQLWVFSFWSSADKSPPPHNFSIQCTFPTFKEIFLNYPCENTLISFNTHCPCNFFLIFNSRLCTLKHNKNASLWGKKNQTIPKNWQWVRALRENRQ